MNDLLQLGPERTLSTLNPSFQIISVDSAEVILVILIVADFLISLMLIYSILTLLLIAIIWLVVRKKLWNL